MSEETTNEPFADVLAQLSEEQPEIVEQPQAEEPTLNVTEQKAVSQGWVPKDQFKGDPSEWRPADVWLDRGELFGKIDDLKKDLKTVREQNKALVTYSKTVEERTRDQTLKELRALQSKAVEEADIDTVNRITDQIVDLNRKPVDVPNIEESAPVNPDQDEIKAFVQRNTWFNADENLRREAIALEIAERNVNPNLSTKDVFNKVEQKIKKLFPEKFENTLQSKNSPVVTTTETPPVKNKSSTVTFDDLPGRHKQQVKYLQNVLGDKFNLKQYIADLKTVGEL